MPEVIDIAMLRYDSCEYPGGGTSNRPHIVTESAGNTRWRQITLEPGVGARLHGYAGWSDVFIPWSRIWDAYTVPTARSLAVAES